MLKSKNIEMNTSKAFPRESDFGGRKKVFWSKGFDGGQDAGPSDVQGINRALLHYYLFQVKDKMFERIFDEAPNDSCPVIYMGSGSGWKLEFRNWKIYQDIHYFSIKRIRCYSCWKSFRKPTYYIETKKSTERKLNKFVLYFERD